MTELMPLRKVVVDITHEAAHSDPDSIQRAIKAWHNRLGAESLAWPLYTKGRVSKLSLSSLLKYYGFKPEPKPHTAMNGASACRNVYLELLKEHQL